LDELIKILSDNINDYVELKNRLKEHEKEGAIVLTVDEVKYLINTIISTKLDYMILLENYLGIQNTIN